MFAHDPDLKHYDLFVEPFCNYTSRSLLNSIFSYSGNFNDLIMKQDEKATLKVIVASPDVFQFLILNLLSRTCSH